MRNENATGLVVAADQPAETQIGLSGLRLVEAGRTDTPSQLRGLKRVDWFYRMTISAYNWCACGG